MKLKGEYILREVAGEILAIPVGRTALEINGMISLNSVSAKIWSGLQDEKTKDEILGVILEEFAVSREEAESDLEMFLLRLQEAGLLEP